MAKLMRWVYSLLWLLLLPLALLRLWWRGRKQPGYRRQWPERLGVYTQHSSRPLLWVHAVSVGESRASAPLVRALQARYPGHQLLLTCMTPTGRDTIAQSFGDSVLLAYLPYDFPLFARRFLRQFRPQLAVFMETEIWPNLLAACREQGVPTVLANARLSQRSLCGYQRTGALAQAAVASFNAIAAQSSADVVRLQQLGGRNIRLCGNLKFDVDPPPVQLALGAEFRQRWGSARPVILCFSTREGEEALLLASRPQPWPTGWLWVIVPRHPQRFDDVATLVEEAGLSLQRRSADQPLSDATQVLLGDSMGEMFAYYSACDLAFIGGSLLPFGAQNLIEAAACGKPILIGPHTFNFAEATRLALAAGAAETVASGLQFWERAAALLPDATTRQARGQAGLQFVASHRGATAKTLAVIESVLLPDQTA